MANQRFHAPEALGEGAQLNRFEHRSGSLKRAYLKRNHSAKATLLPLGESMLRMRRRAGVINPVYFWMFFKKGRDRPARFVVLFHAQRKRLCAAYHQP